MNEEDIRLQDPSWKIWGPYLSERQWGTVREDYSEDGSAWEFSSHETARSKAWRGNLFTLKEISDKLAERVISLFARDEQGNRPVFGDQPLFQKDLHFKDYPLFFEYFHGDTGKGLGASHQTGWTGLVARLLMAG